MKSWWYAWRALVWVTLGRLWWSVHTLLLLFPTAALMLFVLRYRERFAQAQPEQVIEAFAQFTQTVVVMLVVSFLLPVVALGFGTTGLGGDREEGTLVFLLTRPLPRWSIALGKWAATVPLVVLFTWGAFAGVCWLMGPAGRMAWRGYALPLFWGAMAYGSFFHLLATWVRYPTVVGVVYALFVEALLGNMPGVIKRFSIGYYVRSWIYELGAPWGVSPPEMFVPLEATSCAWTLIAITLGSLALSAWVLQTKEYIQQER